MKKLLNLALITVGLNASSFDMSLSQCADLTTQLKQAEADKNYNKVMDVGGMIYLGCDRHLSKEEMDIVLEAIDRAEKESKR